MSIELHGGPGDGKHVEFPDTEHYGVMEQRSTCPNPNHTEIRIHVYSASGVYLGPGPWCGDLRTAAQYAQDI